MAPVEAPDALAAGTIGVEVVYCPEPGRCDLTVLQLPAGATVADALRASGVLVRHGIAEAEACVGVWCRLGTLRQVLREHDRVELYRALKVDPKEARRLRYKGRKPGR